ncbi:hypothetical protein B0A80_12050 [Flavobacterium tructae]|uniref:putative phage abortive infection protein n=1 Tax=Flavobacterium tructae TaxID=1114873 RepID=UPI000B5BAC59|nr:putative phage abortive infection protein [Flavobacterium tructae]OXB23204.1 hypothetical protein B0A80_12050 [Flavobacterium tructae]
MNKKIVNFAWLLVLAGVLILIGMFIKSYSDGFRIINADIDFTTTGQFGDYIGGVVGTFFALAGTLLIFLTFKEQVKQNKIEGFESTFFEMVNLHRENVNQMNYTKLDSGVMATAHHRKVFRLIFREFLECYREVKKFSNSKNIDDYILPKYKRKLQGIIDNNNKKIDLLELIIIDIAYNIVYYGIGEEGEIFLRERFKKKYNHFYFYRILRFIKIKPKRENDDRWRKWEGLLNLPYKKFKEVNEEFYLYRKHLNIDDLLSETKNLIYEVEYSKYYGGHQHRLGHYFRHLFQSYKYLNYSLDIEDKERKFYGKTLRAQLSTYEQALLFINSLSSLGMKWELTPEKDLLLKNDNIEKCNLISQYNLIKNLPGSHFLGIRYKVYYPKVKYETDEN